MDNVEKRLVMSYARENIAYARRVVEELEGRGWQVFFDQGIPSGVNWWRTIVEAIRTASGLVVIVTPDAEKSDFVEKEVLVALRHSKPCFPLLLSGNPLALLINVQHVDVRNEEQPPEQFYLHLAERVAHVPSVDRPMPAPWTGVAGPSQTAVERSGIAGFLGLTASGPVAPRGTELLPDVEPVRSFEEFESRYGRSDSLRLFDEKEWRKHPAYTAAAVHDFFESGGKEAYIARAFEPLGGEVPGEV